MEKRYDHLTSESIAQQQWQTEKTYSLENNAGPLFSIDTPPPTVSGTLHIGHIFSYTQTDIIARYKRIQGFSVFYPFGFDDNGLATERYVEKKRNIRGHEMSRSTFIGICLEESHEAAISFKKLWQKMGLSVDWNYTYSTISEQARKISQDSFLELYKKNYIYRKQEPALYCTTCRTTVAQAELDDIESPSFFNDILFKDTQGNDLTIATTRPELLPACVAVLYHPQDNRYTHLKNQKAIVPLFNGEVPLLEDELVDPEKGSGLVMVCTFGDKTDVIWYKKHNLPYRQTIGLDGKCTEMAGFLQGLKVTDARTAIIEKLRENGLLLNQKAITHAVNVHERCKKEIEFTILPQWFISILPHKQNFLDIADTITWSPAFMKSRYRDWVENLAWDWGISRQRFYGIPFPVWHCVDCGEILLAKTEQLPIDPQETPYDGVCTQCNSTNIKPDTDVMDTWNTSSLTPYICFSLLAQNLSSDSAILRYNPSIHSSPLCCDEHLGRTDETRFPLTQHTHISNNSDTPLSIRPECFAPLHSEAKCIEGYLDINNFLPMSMRPQAHDIIRTWAFDTIVKSWMHHGIAPWENIVISGHVLSDKGKGKISKKDGTATDPMLLLEKYPADAIRYWTATGRLGQDMMFSDDQLLIGQKLITKLWNAFRFAEPHFEGFSKAYMGPKDPGYVNKWMLHTLSNCFDNYQSKLECQEFGLALNAIEHFFWNDFCDNYLELIKNQLFNPELYSADQVQATRWTLYHTGLRILQLYAPYVPHVTETIYQELYRKHENVASIHQTRYQDIQIPYSFEQEAKVMNMVISIACQVRKLKSEKQLSLKTPLSGLYIFVKNNAVGAALAQHNQLICGVTQALEVIYQEHINQVAEVKESDGQWSMHIVLE